MFSDATLYDIYKEAKNVGTTKASQNNDISTKIFRKFFFHLLFFRALMNHMTEVSIFPKVLKSANILSVFKKVSKNSKKIYRHVSILPKSLKNLLCLLIQMYSCFKNVFSKYQCEFSQCFSAKFCLKL